MKLFLFCFSLNKLNKKLDKEVKYDSVLDRRCILNIKPTILSVKGRIKSVIFGEIYFKAFTLLRLKL